MSEPQRDPNRSLLLWFGTPDGLSPDEAVSWESTPQHPPFSVDGTRGALGGAYHGGTYPRNATPLPPSLLQGQRLLYYRFALGGVCCLGTYEPLATRRAMVTTSSHRRPTTQRAMHRTQQANELSATTTQRAMATTSYRPFDKPSATQRATMSRRQAANEPTSMLIFFFISITGLEPELRIEPSIRIVMPNFQVASPSAVTL
jgi:hypothetical protein